MALKYVDETRFLDGVPAKDLTDEEIKELGLDEKALIKAGLYEKVKEVADGSTSSSISRHQDS